MVQLAYPWRAMLTRSGTERQGESKERKGGCDRPAIGLSLQARRFRRREGAIDLSGSIGLRGILRIFLQLLRSYKEIE